MLLNQYWWRSHIMYLKRIEFNIKTAIEQHHGIRYWKIRHTSKMINITDNN